MQKGHETKQDLEKPAKFKREPLWKAAGGGSNDSEESVGDIPIELRHLEEDFCNLVPDAAGRHVGTSHSAAAGIFCAYFC